MKKVMIVDDEFLVRLGIKSLLRWEDYGYTIVAEASGGEEALEKIKEARPQIVLTDLMMNSGDGFMLIERCLKKYPDMKFIVLSNYNDFENVRRAMKLGARDYVFKLTLKAEELLQVLEEAGEDSEQETKRPEKPGREQMLNRNREMVKSGILKNLMEARDGYFEVSLKSFEEFPFNISFENSYRVMTIMIDNLTIARRNGNFLESNLLKFTIENIVDEIFNNQGKEIFQYQDNCFIVIFSVAEEDDAFEEEMEKKFGKLCQYVKNYCGLHLSGVVSEKSRGIYLIKERILENEEALRFRFWNKEDALLWRRHLIRSELDGKKKIMETSIGEDVLERRLQEEGIAGGLACWDALMEEKYRSGNQDVEEFREELYRSYRVLEWYLKKVNIEPAHIQDSNGVNLETAIKEYDFYEEIKESFYELREQYLTFCSEKHKRPCRTEIVEVKSFVQAHYDERLSVSQIADMVNMSESRFAHVFKKEMGISFGEYVNQVRMDQAEKLLKETDLRVGDIAEKIGVENPNYFSTQFKKRKGKSPLAYRNMPGRDSRI